jgi:replicative DNA helicase
MDDAVTLQDVLHEAEQRLLTGATAVSRVWPTGFSPLDTYLGGGLRAGELTLLGGAQGLGKTTFALQILRHVVHAGGTALYFSFEHDPAVMLQRAMMIEAGEVTGPEGLQLRQLREALENREHSSVPLLDRLEHVPDAARAVQAFRSYADRIYVHRSSSSLTSLEEIRKLIETVPGTPVVVVDYLQKVAVPGGSDVESERVTLVVEGLKDLSLEADLPILAIVAADKEGLGAGKRLRIQHFRGSTALGYEPDVVLVLNDKYDIVARHHLTFDVGNAERFRSWAVLSIEKNRGGLDHIDLEFRKMFEQGRYDTAGRAVTEQLVDERVFLE